MSMTSGPTEPLRTLNSCVLPSSSSLAVDAWVLPPNSSFVAASVIANSYSFLMPAKAKYLQCNTSKASGDARAYSCKLDPAADWAKKYVALRNPPFNANLFGPDLLIDLIRD